MEKAAARRRGRGASGRERRRPKGEGSIYYDAAKARYVASVDRGVGADGRRDRKKAYAATMEEARAALRRLQDAAEHGKFHGPEVLTGEYLERWATDVLPTRRAAPNTIDLYSRVVNQYLVPSLGRRRLSELSADDVESALRTLAKKGLSRSTLRISRTVLSLALTHAERRGLVGRNVARLANLPVKAKHDKPTRRVLLPEDVSRFKAAIRGHRLEALWLCGLALGLRPGELTGLTWDGVDVEAGVLAITQSRLHDPDGMRLGAPKTAKARRTLKMPDELTDAFRRRREAWEEECATGGEGWNPLGLVFCTSSGNPVDRWSLRRRLKTVLERAGLPPLIPYELRHSATSLMSDAGVPIEQIADVLGHTTTQMVQTVYRHPVRKVIDVGYSPLDATGAEQTP